ncbi:hypothetical protein [Streptomyces sviceus]|uniref:hypothetical protein n=1 Tax=Streptomyces sviceus TaxID=285530 RepID=UPI00332E3148
MVFPEYTRSPEAPPGHQWLDGTWMAVAGNAAARQVLFCVGCLGVTHNFVTLVVALCGSQAAASANALACDTLHTPS